MDDPSHESEDGSYRHDGASKSTESSDDDTLVEHEASFFSPATGMSRLT
jgi:hypothetical protein